MYNRRKINSAQSENATIRRRPLDDKYESRDRLIRVFKRLTKQTSIRTALPAPWFEGSSMSKASVSERLELLS